MLNLPGRMWLGQPSIEDISWHPQQNSSCGTRTTCLSMAKTYSMCQQTWRYWLKAFRYVVPFCWTIHPCWITCQAVTKGWGQRPDEESSHQIGSLSDPFDPYLICHALMDEAHGFRSVVFGWDNMQIDKPSDDQISKLFEVHGEFDISHIWIPWGFTLYC